MPSASVHSLQRHAICHPNYPRIPGDADILILRLQQRISCLFCFQWYVWERHHRVEEVSDFSIKTNHRYAKPVWAPPQSILYPFHFSATCRLAPVPIPALTAFCFLPSYPIPSHSSTYRLAKQHKIPVLPKNQQHPMKRMIDSPAVAQRSAWKNREVRELAPD